MNLPGPDDELASLLEQLGRRPAPDVKIETILDRWQCRRRRAAISAACVVAGVLLAGVIFWTRPSEAPVHLELRVMDVSDTENGDPLAEVFDQTGGVFGP